MINGVVAQERVPLPRGVLQPVRSFDDVDTIFRSVITGGLTQRLFPDLLLAADELFTPDMPLVLVPELVDDIIFQFLSPVVIQDTRLLPLLHTDTDSTRLPDIRVPGYLLPQLVDSPDVIYPTPLILDRGMLRAELYVDIDQTASPHVVLADTLFAVPLAADDAIYAPLVRFGLGPSFVQSDDTFYPFMSEVDHLASLFIDDARPLFVPTSFDGQAVGATLSADKLTATHANTNRFCGARSTTFKHVGKYYFEVTVGPSHGSTDCIGVMPANNSFQDLAQVSACTAYYVNFGSGVSGGPIAHNNAGYGVLGEAEEGDVVGVAVDLSGGTAWFRRNGGDWNGREDDDPETQSGGSPIPPGDISPVVGFGSQLGDGFTGFPGDSFTANFGELPYADEPPDGFGDWVMASPFGPAINGDSFGKPVLGLPAQLDGVPVNVTMSNGLLTATHTTATTDSGARSASPQNYGRYYFEVTVGATHGDADCVGLVLDRVAGYAPMVSLGSGCAVVYATGEIGGAGGIGSNLGSPFFAGDVIGVAVDLTTQTPVEGGFIWFRRNGNAWNGDGLADPGTITGGFTLTGYNNVEHWVPAVGFGGITPTVGDNFTVNFGGTPFVRKAPNGFGVWSSVRDTSVTTLPPPLFVDDDTFFVPAIDLTLKSLFHPTGYVIDDDIIRPTTSFGGTLMLYPLTVVAAPDAIPLAGYLATLDGAASPSVTLSPNNLTATNTTTATSVGARSRAQQNAGKFYFEVTAGQNNGFSNAIGVTTEAGTYPNIIVNGTNCTVVYKNSGSIQSNNTGSGKSIGAVVTGDVIGVAIDLDLRRAWFRRNTGDWNGTVGADPTVGVAGGGVAVASTASFAPTISFTGGGANVGDSATANFGQTPFVNPAPAGFTNWPGSSVSAYLQPILLPDDGTIPAAKVTPANLFAELVPGDDNVPMLSMTGGNPTIGPQFLLNDAATVETIHPPSIGVMLASLDGITSAVTLSTDKLTATHVGTTNNAGARSAVFKTAGKFYFEVTMTNVHGDSDCVGVMNAVATFTQFVTSGVNCIAIYRWNGSIFTPNGNTGIVLGACTSGDVISFAIDITSHTVWIRKNGGLWNNGALAAQNPNTNTGGTGTGGGAQNWAPAIGFGGANTANNDAMTVNFGASPFAYPAPTNFNKWNA